MLMRYLYPMKKRAVSPLVATVLLIAFAVALGAVFVTYTGSLTKCTNIQITIATKQNIPDICLDTQQKAIILNLQNGPDGDVYGFKATLIGRNENINMDLIEPVGKAETKRMIIPYNVVTSGELEKVRLLPLEKDNVICPVEKVMDVEGIPECS